MEQKKTLTIVICCYNSTSTILNTLNSLDLQNQKDLDVFLIDDGSKDNLKDCVKDYLQKYPDIIHYFQKENGNWGDCLNFAISKANSRYLCVLDSDDTYNSKSLSTIIDILKSTKPETDMVFSNYEFHVINENKVKVNKVYVSKSNKLIRYIPYQKLPLFHLITIHSTIFSVEMLKTINPLPKNVYYSDSLLIYQALLRARNVAYLNKNIFLYKYFIRKGEQSISIERSIKNFHHFEVIYNELLNQKFIDDKKRLKISKRCLTVHIYWLMRILANDYARDVKTRSALLKQFIKQYEDCIKNNGCKTRSFHTFLTMLLKHCPRFAMWITRVALGIIRGGFVNATGFSKKGKKEAKEQKKTMRNK